MTPDKTCARCRSTLPLASFGPGCCKDDRDSYCRECRREYLRQWKARKRAERAAVGVKP